MLFILGWSNIYSVNNKFDLFVVSVVDEVQTTGAYVVMGFRRGLLRLRERLFCPKYFSADIESNSQRLSAAVQQHFGRTGVTLWKT